MIGFLKKIIGTAQDRTIKQYRKIVQQINTWTEKLQPLSDEQLKNKTIEFKERFQKGETLDELLPEAFAVVKETCRRLCGTEVHVSGYDQKWDMVPYDVQMVGAIALHKGAIAEMQTGEGKTLTAVLPLYLNALTGKPVHLVTVNDYLAQRDCQWMGSVFRWLGLTTEPILNSTPPEKRREVYQADIVYGTASEFGFDYLRDNSMVMSKDQQVQRGYYYAIIDEVDSILIDEARTPLIISGPVPESRQLYDELKDSVASLVRRQRDLCNRFASEARKVLDKSGLLNEDAPAKKLNEEEKEALRKLWLVGKGTPRNKVLTHAKENPDLRHAIDQWDLYYYSDQNKQEKAIALSELFMTIDEKGNEFELSDKGIASWQDSSTGMGLADDFVMLDISHEYLKIDNNDELSAEEKEKARLAVQEEDAKRKERAHNLRQLLRAHLLMEKDVDYIVQNDKIIIIDENTGRPQPGRRFSDGLHQAIEAKEHVSIQKETQTYATITLQNFFRMYDKLAGMTGTAITEANEFKQIYKLEVLEIPTHHKCIRTDCNDEIYMSEREKYNAILKEVNEIHAQGRPLLIGTESVEISEKLSRIFKLNKLPHTVLNAKHNEQEAEIVAQAGQKGAIVISTNMAGRGTDIKLGEGVADLGGLYVMGTTRHQSRRIDRQLRGRCSRQGDPGTSKFYVSFEDNLLRLFASPRLTSVLQRFRPPEGEPISAGILNRSIETAQKRIEQRNYMIRKHTLEYDDVMNKQRQEVYSFRNDILHAENIGEMAIELLEDVCHHAAEKYCQKKGDTETWDTEGLRQWLISHFPVPFAEGVFDDDSMTTEDIGAIAAEKVVHAFKEKLDRENKKVAETQDRKPADDAVRNLFIRYIDHRWQEHLLAMDHLRSDVNLRAVGQRDPLTEFKYEAFALFDELGTSLRTEIGQNLFKFEVVTAQNPSLQQLLSNLLLETNRSLVDDVENQQNGNAEEPIPAKITPITSAPKVGRNDDCPCGSGKKYKKCCGAQREENANV